MTVDFARIYATDLVYVPDCWRLCGDAHCCNFRRYKNRFRLIEKRPQQELPLLPGEYAFLKGEGWLAQFQDHEHRAFDYAFGRWTLRIESIVSSRPGCACDHATRPTICRLYPLMPEFDLDGQMLGAYHFGMYEVLEDLSDLARACQVDQIPLGEIDKFLLIAHEIGRDPVALFSVAAYRAAREHLRHRLVELGGTNANYFNVFEANLLRGSLIDHSRLGARLSDLAAAFENRYGPAFSLAL